MKHFTHGRIFCKCSARMHCRGKEIRIYKDTPRIQPCPNCGSNRKVEFLTAKI